MQVVIVSSVCSHWKQPVFFDFNRDVTRDILHRCISAIESAGFLVVAMVCELEPASRRLILFPRPAEDSESSRRTRRSNFRATRVGNHCYKLQKPYSLILDTEVNDLSSAWQFLPNGYYATPKCCRNHYLTTQQQLCVCMSCWMSCNVYVMINLIFSSIMSYISRRQARCYTVADICCHSPGKSSRSLTSLTC